jgi:orotidine-5'-phosphate decarboxylase
MEIIAALDNISRKEALKIAKSLKGVVWGFKINDLLFQDPKIIKQLKKFGYVFADAKLHDIPNTVANSVSRLDLLGADMITVHASGGIKMMQAAKNVSRKSKIIAVTVLTSDPNVSSVGKQVFGLTNDALKAGMDGVVCSALELKYLSRKKILKIVPGIRPKWYQKQDDQKRTATPSEALESGADFIVVGRPITKSKNPVQAVAKILKEIKQSKHA